LGVGGLGVGELARGQVISTILVPKIEKRPEAPAITEQSTH
jgi:hypothetical protein